MPTNMSNEKLMRKMLDRYPTKEEIVSNKNIETKQQVDLKAQLLRARANQLKVEERLKKARAARKTKKQEKED